MIIARYILSLFLAALAFLFLSFILVFIVGTVAIFGAIILGILFGIIG